MKPRLDVAVAASIGALERSEEEWVAAGVTEVRFGRSVPEP